VGQLPFGGWSTDFFTANQLIIENLFYLCHLNLFHSVYQGKPLSVECVSFVK